MDASIKRTSNSDNEQIKKQLLNLTQQHVNWGFKLCCLYLRNVQGYRWNHKRVYRIYCELFLNLRIKPKRRLKRKKTGCFGSTFFYQSGMVYRFYA